MPEIREGDLVRYVGLADGGGVGLADGGGVGLADGGGVGLADGGGDDGTGEDLGVGVAGAQTAHGRVVDFSDTVGLLCCVDEELVAVPGEWTPARAMDLLVCGFSPDLVAELTGYDRRWMSAQHRRLVRGWLGDQPGWPAGQPASAATGEAADRDEPA